MGSCAAWGGKGPNGIPKTKKLLMLFAVQLKPKEPKKKKGKTADEES